MDPTRHEWSDFTYQQSFSPEMPRVTPTQSTEDLSSVSPPRVKDRITAINAAEDQGSRPYSGTKPVVPRRKNVGKTKSAVTEIVLITEQTDELQAVFKKRSSKEIDPTDYEEHVQQNIFKQRQSNKREELQQTYNYGQIAGHESELNSASRRIIH